jgi:hypothetical protein
VAWCIDDVQRHCPAARRIGGAIADRSVLGEDRDALFTLEIHRVEHPIRDVLVGAEYS